MNGFGPGLLWALSPIPAGIVVRIVGIAVGFGLVAMLKRTPLRRPAVAVGDAVNGATVLLAGLIPVVGVVAGVVFGLYRMFFSTDGASGVGMLVGGLVGAVLLIPYLPLVVFSSDRTPGDTV